MGLPKGSVNLFIDLVDIFNLYYASSKMFEKTTSDL